MIAAIWALAATVTITYAALAEFAEDTAHDAGAAFLLLIVAIWAALSTHHHRRHS